MATIMVAGFSVLLFLSAGSLIAVLDVYRSLQHSQTQALRLQSAAADLVAMQKQTAMTLRLFEVDGRQVTAAELASIAQVDSRLDALRGVLTPCCAGEVKSLGEGLAALIAAAVLPAASETDRLRRLLSQAAVVDDAFLATRSSLEAAEKARLTSVLAVQARYDLLSFALPIALLVAFGVVWFAFARFLFRPLRVLTETLEGAVASGEFAPFEQGVREFRAVAASVSRLIAQERQRTRARQRDAEARGRADQARLERMLQDSARVLAELAAPVFVLDSRGRVQLWNRTMVEVSGLPVGSVFGTDLFEAVLDAPSLAPLREAYVAALIGRPSAQLEVQLPRVGGRSVLFSVVPFRSGDDVESVIFVGKDVSEIRSALVDAEMSSRATQHALERLDLVLGASGAVVWEAGAQGGALEVVGQHQWRFRAGPDGMESFREAIHEQDRAPFEQALAVLFDSGGTLDLECRLEVQDGSHRWAHVIAQPSPGESTADGLVLVGSIIDVHERVVQAQRIWDLAHRDALTGLANRTAFTQRFQEAVEDHQRSLMLVLVDLNDFKTINDTLGHAVGDAALRALGGLLDRHFVAPSWPARIGGDEFVVVLEGMTRTQAERALEELLSEAGSLVYARDGAPGIGLSLGVAERLDPLESVDDLLQRADEAMYRAKAAKHAGSAYRFHEPVAVSAVASETSSVRSRANLQSPEVVEPGCLLEYACPGGEVTGLLLLPHWPAGAHATERMLWEQLLRGQEGAASAARMLDELLDTLAAAEQVGTRRLSVTLPWQAGMAVQTFREQLVRNGRPPREIRLELSPDELASEGAERRARALVAAGFGIDLSCEAASDLEVAVKLALPVERVWLTVAGVSDAGRRVKSITDFSAAMRSSGVRVGARIAARTLPPGVLGDLGFDFVRSTDVADCIAAQDVEELCLESARSTANTC